ncbi:Acetyltransferase (isoleucine patch superfamily) [Alkalibacterium subtropicum]|uniref:Acetyltransferase (Isoleucine patch superfamily) n=1 Tax=Alkalibacterium subtropicum TaxID=753702 RepID=A0A1I1GGX6_9LACT|nr:acyltransferase [Alkalibacterium subtropicum]SFC10695.1 Acetyltransferase (isoleucine patch superfamily) [Alkalibacterium subtropicum]
MENKSRGRDKFDKYKNIIYLLVNIISVLPRRLRMLLMNSFRNQNGIPGLVIRYILLRSLTNKCGYNVSIHPGVYIFHLENLVVGDNVSIHPMCYIDAIGGIEIGDDVSIAHSTTIMSSEHKYTDCDILIKNQGVIYRETIIKSNVWIGAGARILAGSVINEGAIIASGAVIKNTVESNYIYGGVPGKKIKER